MIAPPSRRFVPTLTEVFEPGMAVPEAAATVGIPSPQGPWPVADAAADGQECSTTPKPMPLSNAALVADIAARIIQQLDAQIQQAVANELQRQQQQLTQHLRHELMQSVPPLIQAALQAQTTDPTNTAHR